MVPDIVIQENTDAECDLGDDHGLAFVTRQLSAATPPADVGPGRVAWFDLSTTNLPRLKEFYGKLFDWQFSPVKGTDQAAEINVGGVARFNATQVGV